MSSGRRSCRTPCRWGVSGPWGPLAAPARQPLSSPQAMVRAAPREAGAAGAGLAASWNSSPGGRADPPPPHPAGSPGPPRGPLLLQRVLARPHRRGHSRESEGEALLRPEGPGPCSSPSSGSLCHSPLCPLEGQRKCRIAQSAVHPACQPVCQRKSEHKT